MSNKKGLGKGIDALFGSMGYEEEEIHENQVVELPLTQIDPNREQPRKRFDQEALRQLADSMQSVGVIQPITVYAQGEEGRYTIIAGERRWRAARLAGLKTIPALVRDMDRVRRMEITLIENLQRSDLNPIEEAEGIRQLMEECGLTQENAAKRVGRSRPAVANLLRLLALPEAVLEHLRQGTITEGHGRAIAGVEDAQEQEKLAAQVIALGLTVRQTEEAAKKVGQPEKEIAPKPEKVVDEGMQAVIDLARDAFGTKVKLEGSQEKGRLVVEYFSRDDLERIYALLQSLR